MQATRSELCAVHSSVMYVMSIPTGRNQHMVYLELHHKHSVDPEPPMKFRSVSPGPEDSITVIDTDGATQVLCVEEWSPRFVFDDEG